MLSVQCLLKDTIRHTQWEETEKIPAHFQAHKTDGDDYNYKGQHEGGS